MSKNKNYWETSTIPGTSAFHLHETRLAALLKTSFYLWKFQGFYFFVSRLAQFLKGERKNTRLGSTEETPESKALKNYRSWIKNNEPNAETLEFQQANEKEFSYRPVISVLTSVFNTDELQLRGMIESILAQTYSNWELHISANDADRKFISALLEKCTPNESRIRLKSLAADKGISYNYNELLKAATGEYIVLLEGNDRLSPDALYENVSFLNRQPDADMIYSDEDALDAEGERHEPHFKPDWSPDLFYSSFYTGNAALFRKTVIERIGGFRFGFDGAQIEDVTLRLSETTGKIYHIPKILYHRAGSSANGYGAKSLTGNARIRVISDHFKRLNVQVEVLPGLAENLLRVKRQLATEPKVSIIIPTRGRIELLKNCINSILKNSNYSNYEILIINNGSSDSESLAYFNELCRRGNVRIIEYSRQFNLAAVNNYAAGYAEGDLLLFLDSDTEVISPEWLSAMVEHAVRPEVGAVGARLLAADGTVQHAGVIIGIGGIAGHSHRHFPAESDGYFSRIKAIQNISAVTGACLMVRKESFKAVNAFKEKDLTVAFNDVDFCLRLREMNLLIVYTPYAELYYGESATFDPDKVTDSSGLNFKRDVDYMFANWGEKLISDPYYNPNLSLKKEDFSIETGKSVWASEQPGELSEEVTIIEPTRFISSLKLGALWKYRELFYYLALRDIKIRYKQTLLGIAWVLLQPIVTTVIFAAIFMRLDTHQALGVPYALYAFSGFTMWIFINSAITNCSNSLINHSSLVTKVYFPKLIIPFAAAVVALIDFVFGLLSLLVTMLIFRVAPTWQTPLIVLSIFQAVLLALGIGILTATLNVKYRDVKYILPFVLQVLFFISPVFYSVMMLPESLKWLWKLNPVTGILDNFRALLFGLEFDWVGFAISLGVSMAIFIFSVFVFHRMEDDFADVI